MSFLKGGKKMNVSLESLLEKIKSYNNTESDIKKIKKAYAMAEYLHRNTKRDSGEPYIVHPLSVAFILADEKADTDTICACLLHDTLEDTNLKKEKIAEEFGEDVAELVDGVSKLKSRNLKEKQMIKYANMRKLLTGLLKDPRIILIKIADNLHNMRTIQYKRKEKQVENSLETLNNYVPMANLLGTSIFLNELSNRAFYCVDSNFCQKIEDLRMEIELTQQQEINKILKEIAAFLESENIPNQIKYRIKNTYQLARKLKRGMKKEEIKDLIAIKIAVKNIMDCYKTEDIITKNYSYEKETQKDYISSPKDNLYQGLHINIKGNTQIQIQIKTETMTHVAEHGLATYWETYKEYAKEKMKEDISTKWYYKTLNNIDEFCTDNKEFIEQVNIELFKDQVHVYTPQGRLINLPEHATPIDFAYRIHTDVLKHMIGVRVNNEFVPLNYQLQNKDKVTIITDENTLTPNETWLSSAVTTGAKRVIRKTIK